MKLFRKPLVLVVEDEPTLRQLAGRVLTRNGFEVLEAASPPEAVERSNEHPGQVDLVLTDVMMPEMRGWELADVILRTQPGAKVLYMSGYVDENLAGSDRVQPLLLKPFRPQELVDRVRLILGIS